MILRLVICGLLLCSSLSGAEAQEKKRLLLLGQKPDGHPRATHEYLPGQQVLAQCLAKVPGLEVQVVEANNPWLEGPELLAKADGAVVFVSAGAQWVSENPRRLDAFSQLTARGGGLVVLHWGMGTREAEPIDSFLKLFGGCHGGPDRKYKVLQKPQVNVVNAEHPVTLGLQNFVVPREEFYYRLKFPREAKNLSPLLQVEIEGQTETVCWAWERPDEGRSFGFSGLHFHENWQLPEYRRLIAQATLWTLKLPATKLTLDLPASAFELPKEEAK